jgi:Ser/Thr protein kinase RdoA (MazF antagonist)
MQWLGRALDYAGARASAEPALRAWAGIRMAVTDSTEVEYVAAVAGDPMAMCGDFTALTPDVMLEAVEQALGVRLTGLAQPHHSYINRVYEVQTTAGERLIAKFYRPGRWSRAAVLDEHEFVLECAADEIPVVAPLSLASGTLGEAQGILFAVFPKRWGRAFEATGDEDWRRLGRILSRLHVVGARRAAAHRVVMHPAASTTADLAQLQAAEVVTARQRADFFRTGAEILDLIQGAFADVPLQRIHGDCHRQNILERPGEGLMLIDFDDMVMGPPVQDLWMLLPDQVERSRREIQLIVEGYETFQEFDDTVLRLIEPLRAMRMLYFLAWCSRQSQDPNFALKFPDWQTDAFWRQQVSDLRRQIEVLRGRG